MVVFIAIGKIREKRMVKNSMPQKINDSRSGWITFAFGTPTGKYNSAIQSFAADLALAEASADALNFYEDLLKAEGSEERKEFLEDIHDLVELATLIRCGEAKICVKKTHG